MGIFSKILSKQNFKELGIRTNQSIPNETMLWRAVQSENNREKDKLNGIDYNMVVIYFKDGEINNVVPDVNNYYKATHYNINGTTYNIYDPASVNQIPVPTKKATFQGMLGTPVYRLEYLLRVHAGLVRKEGNLKLSYALIHKGTQMLPYSSLEWKREDYLREYFWLLDDDLIEEADNFKEHILDLLPQPHSDKEYTKEVQHRNYALLKRHFKKDIPKSFSSYMRIFNEKGEKFSYLTELGHSIGIDLIK